LKVRFPFYAIASSWIWCTVVILGGIMILFASNPGAPFSHQIATIGGYLFLGVLVSAIHGAVFWYSRRSPIRKRSAMAAIVAAVGMLVLAIFTGFTIGILLIPASILLLLVGIRQLLPSQT
jgi:asparagine N-glycosylation enzyme membrane subunit Stt3